MTTMPIKTLIVLHGNKYIEFFSNQQLQTKIVSVPNMKSPEGELLIEELLELRLPSTWADVYKNGHLLDRGPIRDMRVIDIIARDQDLRELRAYDRIAKGSQLVAVNA